MVRGNLHLAESQHQQVLISYRQTIQRAFGDVSDALIGYDKLHQVRVRQEDTVADLKESVRISTLRYKEELRHIWKFWIARDRFTAPNFHSQVKCSR